MAYVLHYAPDNASLIVRMALDELDVPYTTVLVDRSARVQDTEAYRSINPAGLIPALETPQGPMFETAAILLWLSEVHGRMAPHPNEAARGPFLKWLFFTSNTVHAQMRMLFYPDKYVGPTPEAQAALRAKVTGTHPTHMTLPAGLSLLDTYFATRPERDGPDMLDLYVSAILRWCGIYPEGHTDWFNLGRWPALHAMAAHLEDRPSTHILQAAEGLGPTPFTNPRRPNPPEGSAV